MKPHDLYQGSCGTKRSRDLMIFCRVAVWFAMAAALCAALWGCRPGDEAIKAMADACAKSGGRPSYSMGNFYCVGGKK